MRKKQPRNEVNNEQFADFFNAVLFKGKQVIRPEELEDADTEESSVLEHGKYAESISASRDNIKIRKKSTGYGAEFVMLRIEGQEHIHYAMPMRTMGYDYGVYKKQYGSNAGKYKTAKGMDENGVFTYNGKEVLEQSKTDAGEKNVPYTTYARQIIQMIKDSSEQYGYYDKGYIFCPRSKRITANSIDKKLYNYCNAISVDKKSAHKIRKTFISRLIHSGQIDIGTVCRVAGHVDMKTTFMSYCFSLDHKSAIQSKFEDVLGIG